jgi:DNA mismatch repair protein MutL
MTEPTTDREATDPAGDPDRTENHGNGVERLDRSVVERIAAGEVITRPASVVTELLENSLDAGASTISVAITGNGTERIRVADDGHGMDRKDAVLAVERHTTSKVRAASDVDRVSTLGFRGEALPSIARMGTLALTTKTGGVRGTRVTVEAGETNVSVAGRDVGTTVEVTDLFDRVPARRKALASSKREFAAISEAVTAYALCRPDVRIRLAHDDRQVFSTSGSGRYTDAALGVYGREVAGRSTELRIGDPDPDWSGEAESGPVGVAGLLVHPSETRASADYVHTAVNGRVVRTDLLREAALAGYGSTLPANRYPICVLDVSVPPGTVDVNVHPAKAAVSFGDPDRVADAVEREVREALGGADLARVADLEFDLDGSMNPIEGESALEGCTVIGQFRDAYVLCERDEDLLVIDQHAAHERINYERLRDGFEEVTVETTPIDPAVTVALSPAEAAVLESDADRIESLGFEIAASGGGMVRISRVPAPFGRSVAPESIRDGLATLAGNEDVPDPREGLVKRLACHPSLKAGDALDPETTDELLDRLGACEQPFACPHGRPTVLSIDERTFVRGFDRPSRRVG